MLTHQHPDATRGRLKTRPSAHPSLELQPHVLHQPSQLLSESRPVIYASHDLAGQGGGFLERVVVELGSSASLCS